MRCMPEKGPPNVSRSNNKKISNLEKKPYFILTTVYVCYSTTAHYAVARKHF